MTGINWSGIDVSKDFFDGSILALGEVRQIKNVASKRFRRTQNGVREYIDWVDSYLVHKLGTADHLIRVVMDATGRYSLELSTWLIAARESLRPAIINPKFLKDFMGGLGLRNKTDGIDSRAHCLYGYERDPKPFVYQEECYRVLQELARERAYLVKIRAAQKVRCQEPLRGKPIQKAQKAVMKCLDLQIKNLEAEMEKHVEKHEQLKKDIALLVTIPGIGRITAIRVLGELGDLRLYDSAKQLSAHSGLSPKLQQSGVFKGTTRISRIGPVELRTALYMPSLRIIEGDHPLANKYRNLISKGKAKKSAICAVMRSTLIIMRSMLINNEPYRDIKKGDVKKSEQSSKEAVEKIVENLSKKIAFH